MAGSVAWVFPGQGSHAVGMGRDVYERSTVARAVFHKADQVLGFSLSRICFEGPEEELRRTDHAQPAILITSIAMLEAAREAGNPALAEPPAFVAGNSLGEYTAIIAAGGLDFADGVRLVRERGRLMDEACRASENGMSAVLGLDAETLAQICEQATAELPGEVVQVANLNAPGQVVISGTSHALARAAELAKARGARRALPVAVAGAFHSPVMAPAEARLHRYLQGVPLRDCPIPIVANVSARPLQAADDLRAELSAQLTAAVRWQGSVELMAAAGVTRFIEIGPGQVLTGTIKRTCPGLEVGGL